MQKIKGEETLVFLFFSFSFFLQAGKRSLTVAVEKYQPWAYFASKITHSHTFGVINHGEHVVFSGSMKSKLRIR